MYRGYALDILAPAVRGAVWVAMIWPPTRKTPIVMPSALSEAGVIEVAEAAVDRLLGGLGPAE
jgi:hypothetical protein